MRRLVRRVVPRNFRRWLRRALREAPHRIHDFIPDLRDGLNGSQGDLPLPPPFLRMRVGGTSSRRAFREVGLAAFEDIQRAFSATREAARDYPRWLDFGCGSGRIARHLAGFSPIRELWGIDVDGVAIAWDSRNLEGKYLLGTDQPPTNLPSNHFDVIVASSVFTHWNEAVQRKWLQELSRLLRPGGLLIACTHSPNLTFMRPDLTEGQHVILQREGFLFAPGEGPFNEDGTFQSEAYLKREWGKLFRPRLFEEYGYCRFQDLSVWEKAGRPTSG